MLVVLGCPRAGRARGRRPGTELQVEVPLALPAAGISVMKPPCIVERPTPIFPSVAGRVCNGLHLAELPVSQLTNPHVEPYTCTC